MMRPAFATGAPARTESPETFELAELPGSAVFPEQAVTASVTAASRTPATALFLRMLRVMGCIPFLGGRGVMWNGGARPRAGACQCDSTAARNDCARAVAGESK